MKRKLVLMCAAFLIGILPAVVAVGTYGKVLPTIRGLGSEPSMTISEWTASDTPYKDVESKMAKDFASGKTPRQISQEYRALAAKQPKDPVAQFAAVVAARGEFREANPEGSLPYSLVEMLVMHDPGNVHEYARMRFCMLQEADRRLPPANAKMIGDKLLQYNPKDALVRINLIYMLCDLDHAQAAMPYALKWVKSEPKNEKAHSSLALVYQDLWFATKNKLYGQLAVQEYQQFLRLAPPNDGFRGLAQNSINVLQQEIAKAS